MGLDCSGAALKMCQQRGLDVRQLNLEQDDLPNLGDIDLVVSMEVAEHLPASCADRYVDILCSFTDTVVFSAAVPGQGGTDHVNEQPHEYWIEKFAERGFRFNKRLSFNWRSRWRAKEVAAWYCNNLMVFSRGRD